MQCGRWEIRIHPIGAWREDAVYLPVINRNHLIVLLVLQDNRSSFRFGRENGQGLQEWLEILDAPVFENPIWESLNEPDFWESAEPTLRKLVPKCLKLGTQKLKQPKLVVTLENHGKSDCYKCVLQECM